MSVFTTWSTIFNFLFLGLVFAVWLILKATINIKVLLFPSILQRKNISYVETFFKIKSCLKLIYAVWFVPPFAIFKQPV